tara:strand:+ start:2020 stop:2145 length:126 start_codon:yes stop_codon:yes gene_type:complete
MDMEVLFTKYVDNLTAGRRRPSGGTISMNQGSPMVEAAKRP